MGRGIELERSGAEDPRALESIYRKHHRYVWQTLRAFGVPESATDDAVQDVFLVVHRRLGEFEGRAAMRTWLFEILRRVAWRYRTKAQREASRWDPLPELADPVDLEASLARMQAFEVLQRFADELDEDRLRVFMLSVFGQLRGREISESLGVNLNTVYARLRSAHAELDRFITRHRARESAATVRSAQASRPGREQMRRTWTALAVQVGIAPVGVSAATTAGAAWISWAWAGAAILATSVVVVAVTTPNSRAADAPSHSAGVVRPSAAGLPTAGPLRPSVGAIPTVSTPRVAAVGRPAPVEAPPPPSSMSSRTQTLHAAAPPEPAGQRLALEVAAVKRIQAAVANNGPVPAAVERYLREFPQGTLHEEVDALAIEHLCRQGASPSAQLSAFKRRWPHSTLPRRLEIACGLSIPPQKPRGAKTQPL